MRKRAALIFLWTVSACGGQEPPPRAPETAPQPAPPKPSMQVRGELGSVDPGDVKRVFHTLDDQFLACEKRGVERVEVLSGSVKFFLRIGENGAAKWAYLEDSDLGDRGMQRQHALDLARRVVEYAATLSSKVGMPSGDAAGNL